MNAKILRKPALFYKPTKYCNPHLGIDRFFGTDYIYVARDFSTCVPSLIKLYISFCSLCVSIKNVLLGFRFETSGKNSNFSNASDRFDIFENFLVKNYHKLEKYSQNFRTHKSRDREKAVFYVPSCILVRKLYFW